MRGMDAAFAGRVLEGACFLLWGDASARATVRSVASVSSIMVLAFIKCMCAKVANITILLKSRYSSTVNAQDEQEDSHYVENALIKISTKFVTP